MQIDKGMTMHYGITILWLQTLCQMRYLPLYILVQNFLENAYMYLIYELQYLNFSEKKTTCGYYFNSCREKFGRVIPLYCKFCIYGKGSL